MVILIAGPQSPPRSTQGLGLPYLAAVLEQAGIDVRIADLYPPSDSTDPAELDRLLAEAVARDQPSLVGMTIHTPDYAARLRLAGLLRARIPNTLLVAGGHHPTAEPEELLRHSEFDVCVLGEGEETLLALAQQAQRGDGQRADRLAGVPGIVYRRDGRIIRTQVRQPPADLEALPFPAHHLLGLEQYADYFLLGVRATGLLSYRGCPMNCAFCLNPQGRRVRWRQPRSVVDEMAEAMHHCGVAGFSFRDNMFGLDRRRATALCDELLERKLGAVWECWTGGDLVDQELARKMRSAGCQRVGFGAESGDDEVLARSRRGFSAARQEAGITALKAAGLAVEAFFMFGLPGESVASVRRTVEFARRCGADEVSLGVYRPYPGTAIWRDPESFGLRLVKGPNFEAYVETEALSRAAILETASQASEDLKREGFTAGFLRFDRYSWE